MRIISTTLPTSRMEPVSAPAGVKNRIRRETSDRSAAVQADTAERTGSRVGNGAALSAPEYPLDQNRAVVGAGLTAQSLFHTRHGQAPEESLIKANDAYVRADEMKFRQVPFTLRIA
jgi:hypothetical protein